MTIIIAILYMFVFNMYDTTDHYVHKSIVAAKRTSKVKNCNGLQRLTSGEYLDFRSLGTINSGGYRYTYYSSNVLYHYKTPEWVLGSDKMWRTKDGYLVVASQHHKKGTIIDTPFGKAKVLDYCETPGTIDMYVGF